MKVDLMGLNPVYAASGFLTCSCTLSPANCQIVTVETSIQWVTEGKGDSDLGVHFFERRRMDPAQEKWVMPIATHLPASPITYRGHHLKLNWKVLIRVVTSDDHEFCFEFPFRIVGHPDLI